MMAGFIVYMNQEDIEYAFFAPTPPYVFKQRSKESQVQKHSNTLITAYHKYAEELEAKNNQEVIYYEKKLTAFKEKKCFCGYPLRYMISYKFWGCENYKDSTQKHISFSGENPNIYGHVHIPNAWLTDLIKSCGLKGIVFAKEVYMFFINHGLDDLRIKYGKTTTENTFNGYITAKANSMRQEGEAEKHLKSMYDKVAPQRCIHYKLKEGKPLFCIPDFIVSKDNQVTVVDAKLGYVDDEKMDKYVSLIQFILLSKGDVRKVGGAFILYAGVFIHKSKYRVIGIENSLLL